MQDYLLIEGSERIVKDAVASLEGGRPDHSLVLMAKNCPGNGAHSFHLHLMPDCGNDGINAGMQWTPKGVGLGTIMCNGGE